MPCKNVVAMGCRGVQYEYHHPGCGGSNLEDCLMEEWNYDELLNAVEETYKDFVAGKLSYKLAFARTSYEYETVCNKGKTESLLVHTALGEIALTHEKVFIGSIKAIKRELANVNVNDLKHELTPEEIDDLSRRIDRVLKGLECVQIDYNPIAD